MRKFAAVAFALTIIGSAVAAQAAPYIRYNTINGNVFVENDTANSIINIKSAAGNLTAPTLPNGPLGGTAFVDNGDLPNFVAILNTPVGSHKLGAGTVKVGTPVSDITLGWFTAFGTPEQVGVVQTFVPEPATIAMAGLGMIGLVSAARRRRA